MKRGELWWAQLDEPVGSGPGYRRPVVILQSDAYNRSALRTVIVVAVSSNLALAMAPGNVRLSRADSGLAKAAVVNITQIIALDREQLVERIRMLPAASLAGVEAGARLVLQL